MPETFSHRNADLFVPLQRKLDPASRSHFLTTYARLKKGVSIDRAATEMRALGQMLAAEFGHNHGIDVRSLYEVVVGSIRTPLRVLLGAVFLVLMIACANVANLLLAAGLARRRELAIRLALGAGQRDLARQLTAEAMLLAAAGGALGVLLASWAVRSFVALAANLLPRAGTVQIDGRVLTFTAVLSLLVGVMCGLWPLLSLRTRQLASAVREGDARTGSGTGRTFGNGLVIAEIALAYALLVGAGLLLKNLMYRSMDQQPAGSLTIVMRTVADDPGQTVQAARQIVNAIDPALPVTAVQTMEQVVSASVGQPRLLSALTSLFGGLAGLLAMVGVYGVTSHNVRRQRREFGIRLALGADSASVRRLVVGRGVVVALCGVALGAIGALLLTRTLEAMLNDVKPTDPAVFALNAGLVLLVSIAACYLPARAAGKVDPMVVLRDN